MQTIPYIEARPLLLACSQRRLQVTTQYEDTHYANFDVGAIWQDINKWEIVDFSRHEIDTEKININNTTAEDASFIERHLTPGMYLKVARDGLGMIMHKDATKSRAVIKLAQIWGVSQNGIICFGDDLNDIDMLSNAGISIVMKNALDEVKTSTDYICDSNDNDGVAKWLEENLL